MTSSRTYPPVHAQDVVFFPCMTSALQPLPAHLLNEDVVVIATFSREINVPPSLGACVTTWFRLCGFFIRVLAQGWAQMIAVTVGTEKCTR